MRSRALVTASAAVALTLLGAAGCSSSTSTGSVQSAAASLASQAGPAASSALAAASAAAASALAGAKSALDVKADVSAADVVTNSSGKATSLIEVKNTSDKTADFTVSLTFRDGDGKLLDAVVMNIDNVSAGGTGSGTAVSHRDLSGTVKVQIDAAVRH